MARTPLFSLKPTPEEIEVGVKKYFEENPESAEPLLAAHLEDLTPHPVYDNPESP